MQTPEFNDANMPVKHPFRIVRPALVAALAVAAPVVAASCQYKPAEVPKFASTGGGPTTGPIAGAPVSGHAPLFADAYSSAADSKSSPFSFPAVVKLDEDSRMAGSKSCLACHSGMNSDSAGDTFTMHTSNVGVSCVGCHGGYADKDEVSPTILAAGPHSPVYERIKERAHLQPTHPELWKSSANPSASGASTLQESADYIRFRNPGDLRASIVSCGSSNCHADEVATVSTSMMRHGALLWEAALYNNGSINRKSGVYGEFYTADGKPAQAIKNPLPTKIQAERGGLLSILWPLLCWEISQPGNILRVFERGGERRPIVAEADPFEEPGEPDVKLSIRGYGTDLRTDPVLIGLQKTRLLDPTLNFLGSNDHPGDYRAGGCSACHVIYANDRSSVHSTAAYSGFGNMGQSFSHDVTINPAPKGFAATSQPSTQPFAPLDASRESGYPIQHVMVKEMPTSTCIVCHVHPGTNVLNSYLGFLWWDNETDGKLMYPRHQKDPDSDTQQQAAIHNPEASAAKGLWSNLYPNEPDHTGHVAGSNFLENTGSPEFNQRLTRTQFADFHGHGWVFRAVFKQDRHGHMLDYAGNVVPPSEAGQDAFNQNMAKGVAFQSPDVGAHPPANVPVHLKDIHLERGMQCVDCHFTQDVHGDGNLYTETRNPVQVQCEDCHGTAEHRANAFAYITTDSSEFAKRDKYLTEAFTGTAAKVKTAELDDPALSKADVANARKKIGDYNKKVIASHFDVSSDDPPRFIQKSATDPSKQWTVPQVSETTSPASWWATDTAKGDKVHVGVVDGTAANAPEIDRAKLARYAHTIRTDNKTWGYAPSDEDVKSGKQLPLAHPSSRMSCYACHSSWNTSCFGCHLPQRANQRMFMQHNEGMLTRNYTNYNFQTLRDDVYMLGVDSTARDHKIVPIRSSCAVLVSSQDALRQWIYTQQQTVSAEGYAGTAFTPYFPHTVRSVETKQCTDCHLSKEKDNNAIMAQLMLQGTNSVNFLGRFGWVAEGDGGLEAVAVTERDEPQAVIGSTLHQLAYPENYRKHVLDHKRELTESYEHSGTVLDVQQRGEYLYAACGSDGFIAYDIANIDNKGFSERIITAPVSPLGQQFYVKSKYATCICSPSTLALDPTRKGRPENEEGRITEIGTNDLKGHDPGARNAVGIHLLYAFLYMTDREEGLIVIGNPFNTPHEKGGAGVSTLLDGDPDNNFLQRALTFNPGGILNGARHIALYGTLAYISCNRGIVVVDLNYPLNPKVVAVLGSPDVNQPRKVAFQFRYAFVCDADGLKVLDITDPRDPKVVRNKDGMIVDVPILDARDIFVSRTYGYVAAGHEGLVILDLEKPEEPRRLYYPNDFPRDYNADAGINDATAVRIGMTNASMFAYVADGKNGLKVLQLTSPEYTPTYLGFSPKPEPRLVARFQTRGPAIALSKGLERDRAVDESGNQLSVFNRKGARPFTLEEMQRLYLGPDRKPWFVSDVPEGAPIEAPADTTAPPATEAPAAPPPPRPSRLPFGPKH